MSAPAVAQETGGTTIDPAAEVQAPGAQLTGTAAGNVSDSETIIVTGSRIARPNLVANSPISVVTGEATVANADITLDTYLNTLPGVNPAGTTTSNNPPNGGQSNIDLRGLGANRNLVLFDGRRPMVSTSDQTVDLNTIPEALVDRIEIITGGAGAAYGADAIAGVVNIRLKQNFSGLDLRASYANGIPRTDSREFQFSGVAGLNFSEDRGNITIAGDYSKRQALIKSQRSFAAQATATTSFLPEGLYAPSGNEPTQAAVDSYFTQFGAAPGSVNAGGSLIGFNTDGSLFSRGVFNNPSNVVNFRYPIDTAVNANLFPDLYSYNFDAVNILVLPLERKSGFAKGKYTFSDAFEVFGQANYTDYSAVSALAPTPVPTVAAESLSGTEPTRFKSALIPAGRSVATNQLIVPITNPFIPTAFRALLATRTGDNANLVGSGATEPFLMRQRTLSAGIRQSVFDNEVYQVLGGVRGKIAEGWRYEAYFSEGRTTITETQTGNIDTQRLQGLLEAADGGNSLCAGGFNPFGRNTLSQACLDYLQVSAKLKTKFQQRIAQAFVSGDLFELPAGTVSAVLGAEYRRFKYDFDPGALAGPVSGLNAQDPAAGRNSFKDVFGELLVPIFKNSPLGQSLELNLGARYSDNKVRDTLNGISGKGGGDWAYKAELSYQPIEQVRLRGSYQRSVRAPNFGELFDGGGDNPQYFDPCSITSTARTTGAAAAQITALCTTGNSANADTRSNITVAPGYVQTPGTQISLSTQGNTNLGPEKGQTFTGGIVLNNFGGAFRRVRGSIDYYNIKVKDRILQPDPNLIVANCYNYFGNNPTYSGDNANCQFVGRAGGDILGFGPQFGDGDYLTVNAGTVKTSGIDVQLGYGVGLPFINADSALDFDLLLNYVIDYKVKELTDQPTIDYAGTVSVFGASLGGSVPEWRSTLNTSLKLNKAITLTSRIRYIDGMKNRYSRIYIGEQSFTGVGEVFYFDFSTTVKVEQLTIRAGLNNAFNRKPPTYTPNVQSGTDPSLYDVIGRRFFVQAGLRF